MKILQIGGGSMGARRLRDLRDIGGIELGIVDARPDRRDAAQAGYDAVGFSNLDDGLAWEPDALVISTPPDTHRDLVGRALARGLDFFCEVDLWPYDYRAVEEAAAAGLVAAASYTLFHHPIFVEIERAVLADLGTVHSFGHLISVNAPGWHPTEGAEYYARRAKTSPGREMVPFELRMLNRIFGAPQVVSSLAHQRGRLGLESDDTWALQYSTERGASGQLTVAMASPAVVRRGWALGDRGFIGFDLVSSTIERRIDGDQPDVRTVADWLPDMERAYRDEMVTFVSAVRREIDWPHPYREVTLACATLAAAERSMETGQPTDVRLDVLPGESTSVHHLTEAAP